MPQENVDIVRRAYEAFSSRNFDAIAQLGHPDVEWRPYLSDLGGEPLRGIAAVRGYLESLAAEWDELQVEVEGFREVGGNTVLVSVRTRARGKESGAQTEIHAAHVVTLRDGKIWRHRTYVDRNEALEAVGLRE
jgi:ketosteroid isomerase-like protein